MENDKLLKNLTDEQIAKAKQCRDPKEFLKLAGEGDFELTDDQLDAVSGGVNWPDCPTYAPGQNAPIPEALSNNPRVVHLIRSNITE